MSLVITIAIASVIASTTCAVLGFLIGQRHERQRWNDLIDEGKLPKPGGK